MPDILDQNTFLEVSLSITYPVKQSLLPNQRRLQKDIVHFPSPYILLTSHVLAPSITAFSALHRQESSPSQMCLKGGQSQGIIDLLVLER